jgi:peptidoglycan hydrolase-like protein with peptidoglycan-binding domain
VFFIDRVEGPWVWGLGGNQSDAVTVKRYPISKLLGLRRAGNIAPAVTMTVREVQMRLRALGYHEVGTPDGLIGPRTRAGILAFRDDNALPLVPIIDVALTEALVTAAPRDIAPERASGAPTESRIVTAANAQIGLGVLGAAGSVMSQIAPAVTEAENARALADRVFGILGLEAWLSATLPWLGAAVFVGVIIYAVRARSARINDHRTGKTA